MHVWLSDGRSVRLHTCSPSTAESNYIPNHSKDLHSLVELSALCHMHYKKRVVRSFKQSRRQVLITLLNVLYQIVLFGVKTVPEAISYPEPSSFLQRMLDEKEGLWKGPVLKVHK